MQPLTAEGRARNAAAWVLRLCIAGMCIGYLFKFDFRIIDFGRHKNLGIAFDVVVGLGLIGGSLLAIHRLWFWFWYATWVAIVIIVVRDVMAAWPDPQSGVIPFSRATRLVAPFVLIHLLDTPRNQAMNVSATMLLRIAAAGTFLAHGFKAWMQSTSFKSLITGTFANIGVEVDPVTCGMALKIIGAVDIIVAGLVLVAPWRPVVAWMAFWGFLAAGSRMTAYGLDAWYETAIRLPNGGVPLALLCLWWYRKADDAERGSIDPPLNGDT